MHKPKTCNIRENTCSMYNVVRFVLTVWWDWLHFKIQIWCKRLAEGQRMLNLSNGKEDIVFSSLPRYS